MTSKRGYMGSTVDGGIDDADRPEDDAPLAPAEREPQFITSYRALANAKTTVLNEALAWIDQMKARLHEAERERDEWADNASKAWAARDDAWKKQDAAESRALAAEAALEEVRGDAERYRKIRLKAWLDSCVDDLVIGTRQAAESEFNDGYDQHVDAEYPSSEVSHHHQGAHDVER